MNPRIAHLHEFKADVGNLRLVHVDQWAVEPVTPVGLSGC